MLFDCRRFSTLNTIVGTSYELAADCENMCAFTRSLPDYPLQNLPGRTVLPILKNRNPSKGTIPATLLCGPCLVHVMKIVRSVADRFDDQFHIRLFEFRWTFHWSVAN